MSITFVRDSIKNSDQKLIFNLINLEDLNKESITGVSETEIHAFGERLRLIKINEYGIYKLNVFYDHNEGNMELLKDYLYEAYKIARVNELTLAIPHEAIPNAEIGDYVLRLFSRSEVKLFIYDKNCEKYHLVINESVGSVMKIESGMLLRHYKWGMYRVYDVGMHTETEDNLVAYRSVQPNKDGKKPLWFRPIEMFGEFISEGVQRFIQINEEESTMERLQTEIKSAMKVKDKLALGVLTILKSRLDSAARDKKESLTDDDILVVVRSEIKQTNQALDFAQKSGREDLIEKEEKKIKILESFLPEQLSDDEAKSKLKLVITSEMNMGEAMKLAKSELNGVYDNSKIAVLVKQLIQ